MYIIVRLMDRPVIVLGNKKLRCVVLGSVAWNTGKIHSYLCDMLSVFEHCLHGDSEAPMHLQEEVVVESGK